MIIMINITIILEKNNKPYSSVWLERGANNAKVVGSIPTVAIFFINIILIISLIYPLSYVFIIGTLIIIIIR